MSNHVYNQDGIYYSSHRFGLLNMFFLVILHFDKRRILTWRESIQHDREKQSLETETTNDKT